jgi:YfiH family protein
MVIVLLYNAVRFAETMPSAVDPVPPGLPPEFTWSEQPWGLLLECLPLAAAATHGWTTRQLAITAAAVDCSAQWGQLAKTAGVPRASLAGVHQVHGASVIDARELDPEQRTKADGLVSDDPSVVVTVRVADCVPLLIADTHRGVVAVVHAGWRGTAAGITAAAVSRLTEAYGSSPANLIAALGPSIGPCCYIVGAELLGTFREGGHGDSNPDRWFLPGERRRLDLWAANRDQLAAAGVPSGAIFVSGLCTACHPAWFYSYRREGAGAGRLIGFIGASRTAKG